MTLEAILQECALSGYSLLFRGFVTDVEGTEAPKPRGVEIIFDSPGLALRYVGAYSYDTVKDRAAFVLSVQATYRKFKEMLELRAKILLIVRNATKGISLPQVQALAHSYGSYDESKAMLDALLGLSLVRQEETDYYPV